MIDHPIAPDSGYSPPLHIDLELHGERFDVAEIGPEFLRVRGAVAVAPGMATVRIELDDRLIVSKVHLFDGIDPQRKRQPCRTSTEAAHDAGRIRTALAG